VSDGNSIRVLVVEDEQDILDIILRHLRANGFLPDGFTDPVAALEEFKIAPNRFAVVLTDIRMPRMSGLQLAREVLMINPKTKVVIMTAFELVEGELGDLPVITVKDVIRKPFRLTEICNRIKKQVVGPH
jgi:DNA-binding response OmpR family regulator